MIKILYAAGNNKSARIQLSRFLEAVKDQPYIIKIAAFKRSSPTINIDWTLDCLLNLFKPEQLSFDGDNFSIYYEQVKNFNPNLIISDLEYFTSHIANLLNIPLWQCSASIINFALTRKQKYNLGIFKHHAHMFNRNKINVQRTINILDNSDKNFVYSHFGDTGHLEIQDKFEWIRPYHTIGKKSVPCRHDIVGTLINNNKQAISALKKYSDAVIFTESPYETYPDLMIKDIGNNDEYFCNLHNSHILVCEGQTSFLADAYYNGKPSAIYVDYDDSECVLNKIISEHLKLSSSSIEEASQIEVSTNINNQILMLHDKITQLNIG